MRVGGWLNKKPMRITGWQMGKDRGLRLYGLSRQGYFGDRKDEYKNGKKPAFYDIIKLWQWEAWESFRGTDKKLAQKAANNLMHELLVEFGYAHVIPDPNRPGPDYYSECKKYNWVDELVKKHEEKTGLKYVASKDEMDAILKLSQDANIITAGVLSFGLVGYSLI